jgi:hypothetical protein
MRHEEIIPPAKWRRRIGPRSIELARRVDVTRIDLTRINRTWINRSGPGQSQPGDSGC